MNTYFDVISLENFRLGYRIDCYILEFFLMFKKVEGILLKSP